MRLREHAGIIPGRIDILYCKPSEITVEEGYNVRDLTTAEARAELDELKAQVKEHGVQTPLKIRFNGEQIILVEGHRRRTVALELIAEYGASGGAEGRNIESVPIFPEAPGTTVEERDAGLFVSNTGSRLKPLELANLIYRMHKQRGLPLEAVAQRLAISMPVLKNHLAMRAMPEPVKEHVREGDISATEAAKLMKTLPAGTDPNEAAKIIAANKEENKRLGVGKKTQHKVTAKTLQRDRPKAETKKPVETKPDSVPTHTTVLPPAEIVTGVPVAGVVNLDQLQEQLANLTASSMSAEELREYHRAAEGATAASIPPQSHKADILIFKFMSANAVELAAMYRRLVSEKEQAAAEDRSTFEQNLLIDIADNIGELHFQSEWRQAKANTEMEYA